MDWKKVNKAQRKLNRKAARDREKNGPEVKKVPKGSSAARTYGVHSPSMPSSSSYKSKASTARAAKRKLKRDQELREQMRKQREDRVKAEVSKTVRAPNPMLGAEKSKKEHERWNRQNTKARSKIAKGQKVLSKNAGRSDEAQDPNREGGVGSRTDKPTRARGVRQGHRGEYAFTKKTAKRRLDKKAKNNYKGDYFGPDEFKGNENAIAKWKAAGKPRTKSGNPKVKV